MISTQNLSVAFGSQTLFEEVDVKFTPGNCYGLIGANGAGKSTFLKCLAGKIESTSGSVSIEPNKRLSMLSQDHFAFNEVPALTAVIMGHKRLHALMEEKDALYAKPDFSEADGVRAGELEAAFADLNGWNAEAEAAKLLSELGVAAEKHASLMKDLSDSEKVRVLMAQALFGNPDILLLDEPTNHLDVDSILWLEEFLLDFPNTVVVVSHDRHFLDKVCTHIADIDFGKVTLYSGNYTFWYETSQMALGQRSASNKKKAEQIEELKAFIARFSANASKSRQASSRKKLLDKITLDDIRPSTRKYPFIQFKAERALGKEVVTVEGLRKTIGGEVLFDGLSFSIGRGERVALVGDDRVISALLDILAGESKPDAGTVTWGRSTKAAYFPKDNNAYFATEQERPRVAAPVRARHPGRDLHPFVPGPHALHLRRGSQEGRGPVGRRAGALHALPADAAGPEHAPAESAHQPSRSRIDHGAQQWPLEERGLDDLLLPRRAVRGVAGQPGHRALREDLLRPPHELLGLSRGRRETGPGRPARGVRGRLNCSNRFLLRARPPHVVPAPRWTRPDGRGRPA